MPYGNVLEIVNDLASYADETDATVYTVPPSRQRRLGHYVQRAMDEIWGYRPWSFKYALHGPFSFSNGFADIPDNFANIGDNGMMWNEEANSREPWAEVAMQDMVALRATGRDKGKRWFTVGLLDQAAAATDQFSRQLWIPKDDVTFGSFKLFFEMNPRMFDLDNLSGEPVPLPELFHNTLFAGALAKLQQAKGDPLPIWRAEYVALLAKVTANFHIQSGQMEQMPNTVGGQW
jgi:hypothetical protein